MAKTLARRVIPPFVVSCGFLLTSNPRAQTSVAAPPSQTIPADAEELIAEKPPSCPALDDEDVASANGRKVAWRCPTNDRWTVIVNGVPQGGGFEEARWLIFSPDGQHMAFAARRDKRWMIVEDGRERPTTYAEVGPPEYSDDGKHIAYAAKAAKKWRLVVDGEPRGGRVRRHRRQELQSGRTARRLCRTPPQQVCCRARREGRDAVRHRRRDRLQLR